MYRSEMGTQCADIHQSHTHIMTPVLVVIEQLDMLNMAEMEQQMM